MLNLTATIDRDSFNAACAALPDDVVERIAGAFPAYFKDAFRYPGDAPAPKPGPAKTKAAAVDFATVKAGLLAIVTARPGERAEHYATVTLHDGKLTKRALEALVRENKLYADGEKRGRRYKPRPQNGQAEVQA